MSWHFSTAKKDSEGRIKNQNFVSLMMQPKPSCASFIMTCRLTLFKNLTLMVVWQSTFMQIEQQLQGQGNIWRLLQETPRRFRDNILHKKLLPSAVSQFYSKGGEGTFFRGIGKCLPNYTASYHRREKP